MSPLVASRTVADRAEGALDNVVARINAEAMLRPSNFFENWHFGLIGDDGDPVGLEVGMPEDPDGFFVYLSEKDRGPGTMTAQNLSPIPINQASFVLSQARVEGDKPTEKAFAAPIAPPPQPSFQLVNDARKGFKAGAYWVSYNWIGSGQRTTLAPAVQVTVLQGQRIRIFLPQDIPEGVTGIGVWLSAPNGAPSTMRMQARVPTGFAVRDHITLTGPYRRNPRREPSRNETKKGRPNKPALRLVKGKRTLKKGRYRVRLTHLDEGGESGPGDYAEIEVQQDLEGFSIQVVLDPDRPSGEDRVGARRRIRASIRSRVDIRGEEGDVDVRVRRQVRVYVNVNGKEFLFRDRTKGTKNRPLDPEEEPTVELNGNTEDDDEPGNPTTLSPTEEPTEEDETGIEPPTQELEPPVGLDSEILTNGNYWLAVAYSVRGQITTISKPVRVPASQFVFGRMLRVVFPDEVEAVKNPTLTERDSSDAPFDHVFTVGAAGSEARATEEGEAYLATGGPQTGTALTPQHHLEFAVDREEDFRVMGEVQANLQAGLANATLLEFDEANTQVASHDLATEPTGAFGYERVMGPDGTPWNANTVKARVVHRFVGDPTAADTTLRNGTILAWGFSGVVGLGVPRTVIPAPPGSRERDDTDPPKEARKPRRAQKSVGLAPRGQRRPPSANVVDRVDFGQGASVFPANWSQRLVGMSATDTSATGVTTAAAIDGDRGYHIQKTSATSGYNYMHRSVAPATRQRLAVRAKFRVGQLPTNGFVTLLYAKSGQADGNTNGLSYVNISAAGNVGYIGRDAATGDLYGYRLATGVVAGDVLDLELLVSGGGTAGGYINAAVGKNGQTRTFAGRQGPFNWTNNPASVVQAGVSHRSDPAAKWGFDLDSIVLTETGDVIADAGKPPALRPLKLPNRPYKTPGYLASASFDGGAVDSGWTLSPAQPGNTRDVLAAAAIDGTHGLRMTSVAGDTSATAMTYVEHALSSARATAGLRAAFRFNTLPGSGSLLLAEIADAQGRRMAVLVLEEYAAGKFRVSVRAHSPASGASLAAVPIANVAAGEVLYAEIVAVGAGTQGGLLAGWASKAGSGVTQRQLMAEVGPVDWTGAEAARMRAGAFEESSASLGWSIDLDGVRVTNAGEAQFREQTADGQEINQIHVFYPKGQPVRNDLFFRGFREAVLPGLQYTASVRCRYRGVNQGAQPFFFTAHDLFGNAYDLGSLMGTGVTDETRPWAEYARTFTIPEGCFEVRMRSRGMGRGEWVVQEFSFSEGHFAETERTFPATGTARFTLDTKPGGGLLDLPRRWREVGCAVELPQGTSAFVTYASSDSASGPFLDESPNPDLIPERRYVRVNATLNSSPDRRRSPVILAGSPFVDYAVVAGSTQVATLVREDRSELPGGALVTGLGANYDRSRQGRRVLPGGGVRVTRLGGDPVGRSAGCTVGVFSEEAARILQETDEDLVIEARDRLLTVRPEKALEFSPPKAGTLNRLGVADWALWAEAQSGPMEVVEESVLPWYPQGVS